MRVITQMIEHLVQEGWLLPRDLRRLQELGFYPGRESDEDTEVEAQPPAENDATIWDDEQERLEIASVSEARERRVARRLAWTRRGRRIAANRKRAA